MLDLPEPWLAVEAAAGSLGVNGIVCSYVPTVPQLQRLADALRRTKRFTALESFETMHREWKVEGRSVRPESQMVGHTGFVTVARHIAEADEEGPSEEGPSDA